MVWLATVSTVVGIATGMFTLRDQVLPSERGSAAALSVPVYQQQVGRVCDELNKDGRLRARETRELPPRLKRATTNLAQRNALLDAVRKTTVRSEHAFAAFRALVAPRELVSARQTTMRAWSRNLGRVRAYAVRLDRAGNREALLAAIDYLSSIRTDLSRDGVEVTSALGRLGGSSCDLRVGIVTPAFTLPPLQHRKSHPVKRGHAPPAVSKTPKTPPLSRPQSAGPDQGSTRSAGTPNVTMGAKRVGPGGGGNAGTPGTTITSGGGED